MMAGNTISDVRGFPEIDEYMAKDEKLGRSESAMES